MKLRWGAAAAAILTVGATGVAVAQADMDFAADLWSQLAEARLVGPNSIGAVPYPREGQAHPATLVTFETQITVGGVTGLAIVKRGYSDAATRGGILADPTADIAAISVMFQQEAGYDPDNGDWFWAMYTPAGDIATMEGMSVAGKVAMCSGCHANAEGGDFVFLH